MRFELVLAALACASCAPAVDGDGTGGTPCDEAANCSIVDGVETCDLGYLFEEPDSDDFRCRDTGWNINDRVDPVDDKRIVNFTKDGDTYTNFVGTTVGTAIGIICQDGDALIIFGVGTTDADINDRTDVTVRVGSATAEDLVAIDSDGILFFEPEVASRLAQSAQAAESVVLRFEPLQKNQETIIFDTADLAAVTAPYASVCGFN